MKLKIKNRDIFFAVENCWYILNYKLKYQINELVTLNSEDDFIQEVDIDADSFIKIMLAVNSQPQGIAKDINPAIHLSLKEQIFTQAQPIFFHLSQLTDEKEIELFKIENAEILTIAEKVQTILDDNLQMLESKILNGKTQILE